MYADRSNGTAESNQLFGFVIGVQVSDQSTPDLIGNRVDGAGLGGVGILYGLDGGGSAAENRVIAQQLGFQLSGTASPELIDNSIEDVSTAAFLIQGTSAASLVGNTCEGAPVGIVVLEAAAPAVTGDACPVAG